MSNIAHKGPFITAQIAAPAAVTAGQANEGAAGVGFYSQAAASGEQVTVIVGGQVKVAKETGVAFTFMDMLYWDATNNRLDKTNTNIPAGLCMADAASGDTDAIVLLGSGPGDS